ncbi:class I SAM-dependent methyltransferase, partial [bacterium]
TQAYDLKNDPAYFDLMRNLFDLAGVPFRGDVLLSPAVRQIVFNDVGNIGKYQIKHVVIDHIGTPVIYEYIDVIIPLTAGDIITTYRNAKELKETGNYFNDMRYLYLLEGVPIRGNSNSPYVRQILFDDASNIGKTQIKRVNYETGALEDQSLNRAITAQDIANMYAGAVQLVRDSYVFNTIKRMSQLVGVPFRGDIKNSPILRQIIFDLVTMTGSGLLEIINPFGTFDIAPKATLGELMQMIRGLGILFDNYIELNRETLGVILNGDASLIETYRGRRALDIQKWMELIAMVGVGENKYFIDAYQLGKALLHAPEIINVLAKELGYTLDPAHNPMHMRLLMLNIGGVYYGNMIGNEKIVSFYNDEAAYNRISFGKVTPVPFKGYIKLIDSDIAFARFTNEIKDGKIQMTLEYIDGNLEDWSTTDKVILTEKRVYDIRTSNLEMTVIPVDSRHFWLMEYDQNQTDYSYYSLVTNEDDIGKTYQFFRVPASSRMFWCDTLTLQKTLFASGTVTTEPDTQAGELTQTIIYYIGKGNINNTQKQVIDLNSTTGRAKRVNIGYPYDATTVSSTNELFFGPFALFTNNVEPTGYNSSTELKTRTIGEIHIPELVEENGTLVFVGTRKDETGTYTVHINPRLLGAETRVIDDKTNSETINSDFFGNIAGKSVYRETNGYSERRYLKMAASGVPVFVDGLLEMESEDDLGLSFEMKLAPAHFGAAVWVKNKASKAETEFERDKFYGPVGLCATYREFLDNGKPGYWQKTYLGEKPAFDAQGNITNAQITDNLGNNQTAIINPHHFGLAVSMKDEEGALTENFAFYGRAIIDSKYSLGGYSRTMKAQMETETKPVFENAVLSTVVSDEIIPALNMKIDLNHMGAPVESYNPATGAVVKYATPYGPMVLQSVEQDGLKVTVSEIRRDDDGNPLRTDIQGKNNLFINDITIDFGPAKSVINREVYSDLKGRNWFGRDDDGTELTYLKHFGQYSTLIQGSNGGLSWRESAGDKPIVLTYNPLNQGEVRAYKAHYTDNREVSKNIYRDVNRGDNVIEILGDRYTETSYDYDTFTVLSQTSDAKTGELISDSKATFDFLNRYWNKTSIVNYDENNILRKEVYRISPYGKVLYGRMGKEDFVPTYNGYLEIARSVYRDGVIQRKYIMSSWENGEVVQKVSDFIKGIELQIVFDIYGRSKEIIHVFPGLTQKTTVAYPSATERPKSANLYYNDVLRFSSQYGKATIKGRVPVILFNYVIPGAQPVNHGTTYQVISDEYYVRYDLVSYVDMYADHRTIRPEGWQGNTDRLIKATETKGEGEGVDEYTLISEINKEISSEGFPLTVVSKYFKDNSTLPSYTPPIMTYNELNHRREPYYIKGVCLPIDVNTNYAAYIKLMSDAGFNTGKLYMNVRNMYKDAKMFREFSKRNMKLIVTFVYDKSDTQESFIQGIENYLTWYNKTFTKNGEDPVLMFSIGNEQNFQYPFKDADDAKIKVNLAKWAIVLENAAGKIKEFNKNNKTNYLVTTAHGELPTADFVAKVPSVDIWGTNVYRWIFLETIFYEWNKQNEKLVKHGKEAKPLWLAEVGADAYDNDRGLDIGRPQDSRDQFGTQAFGIDNMFRHIYRARKFHSGVCWFELADEWNKAGNSAVHDDVDKGFTLGGAYPDNYANEEWWGLCKWDDQHKTLTPRPAFSVIRDYYKEIRPVPPLPHLPIFKDAYITDTRVLYWHENFEGERTYYDVFNYGGLVIPLYSVDRHGKYGMAIDGIPGETHVTKVFIGGPVYGFYDKERKALDEFNFTSGIPAVKFIVYNFTDANPKTGENVRAYEAVHDRFGRFLWKGRTGPLDLYLKVAPQQTTTKTPPPTKLVPASTPQKPSFLQKVGRFFKNVGKAILSLFVNDVEAQNPISKTQLEELSKKLHSQIKVVDKTTYKDPNQKGKPIKITTFVAGEENQVSDAYVAVPFEAADAKEQALYDCALSGIRKFLRDNGLLGDVLNHVNKSEPYRIRPIQGAEGKNPVEFKDWITWVEPQPAGYECMQINFAQHRVRFILRAASGLEVGSLDYELTPDCKVGELLGVGVLLEEKDIDAQYFVGGLYKPWYRGKVYLVYNVKSKAHFLEVRNKADFGILEQKYSGEYIGREEINLALLKHYQMDDNEQRSMDLRAKLYDFWVNESTEICFYGDFIARDGTKYPKDYLRLSEIPETSLAFLTTPDRTIVKLYYQWGWNLLNQGTGALSFSKLYDLKVDVNAKINDPNKLQIISERRDAFVLLDENDKDILANDLNSLEIRNGMGRVVEAWFRFQKQKDGTIVMPKGAMKIYAFFNGKVGKYDIADYTMRTVVNNAGEEEIRSFSSFTHLGTKGTLRYKSKALYAAMLPEGARNPDNYNYSKITSTLLDKLLLTRYGHPLEVWEEIKDHQGRLSIIIDGFTQMGKDGFAAGIPSWVTFLTYAIRTIDMQHSASATEVIGVPLQSLIYDYNREFNNQEGIPQRALYAALTPEGMTGHLRAKNEGTLNNPDFRYVYNAFDKRPIRAGLLKIAIDVDGRLAWEIYKDKAPFRKEKTKIIYDNVYGKPEKTYQIGWWKTGWGDTEKLWYKHVTVLETGENLGHWTVWDVEVDQNGNPTEGLGIERFIYGDQIALNQGQLLFKDRDSIDSTIQRNGKHFYLTDYQFEIKGRFIRGEWKAYREKGLKGVWEYLRILFGFHSQNDAIHNIVIDAFKRGTWKVLGTEVILIYWLFPILLPILILLAAWGLSKHFRRTSRSRDYPRGTESPEPPTPIEPSIRAMIYRMNPTLSLFWTDKMLEYFQEIVRGNRGNLQALKDYYYPMGSQARQIVDLWLTQDIQNVIIKPMVYLYAILLSAEGKKADGYNSGNLKVQDGGFVFSDDYARDYFEYCLEQGRDPFNNPSVGNILLYAPEKFERFIQLPDMALERKNTAGQVVDSIWIIMQELSRDGRVLESIREYLTAEYASRGLHIPEYPLVKTKGLRSLSYFKFQFGSFSFKGLGEKGIWIWITSLVIFGVGILTCLTGSIPAGTMIILMAMGYLTFKPGPWIKLIQNIRATRKNYQGNLNQEELREKQHFSKVYFNYLKGNMIFFIIVSTIYTLGTLPALLLAVPVVSAIFLLTMREAVRSFWYMLIEGVAMARDKIEGWHYFKSYESIDTGIINFIRRDAFLSDVYLEAFIDGTLNHPFYGLVTPKEAEELKDVLNANNGSLPELHNWKAKEVAVEFFNKVNEYRQNSLSIDDIMLETLKKLHMLVTCALEQVLPSEQEIDKEKGFIISTFKLIKGKYRESWKIYLTALIRNTTGPQGVDRIIEELALCDPSLDFKTTVDRISGRFNLNRDELSYQIIREWVGFYTWNVYRTIKTVYHSVYTIYKIFLRHKLGHAPTEAEIESFLSFYLFYAYKHPGFTKAEAIANNNVIERELERDPREPWVLNQKNVLRSIIDFNQADINAGYSINFFAAKMRAWAFAFPYIDDGSKRPGLVFTLDFVHSMMPATAFLLPFDVQRMSEDGRTGFLCPQLEDADDDITPTAADQKVAENAFNTIIVPASEKVAAHSDYGPTLKDIAALRGKGIYFSNIEDTATGNTIMLAGYQPGYGRTVLYRPREKTQRSMPSFNNRFDGLVINEGMSIRNQKVSRSDLIHSTQKMGLFQHFDFYYNNRLILIYNLIIFAGAMVLVFSPFKAFAFPLFFTNLQYVTTLAITSGGIGEKVSHYGVVRGLLKYRAKFWSRVMTFLPLIAVGAYKAQKALNGISGIFSRGVKLMQYPREPFKSLYWGDNQKVGLFKHSVKWGVWLLGLFLIAPLDPLMAVVACFFIIFPIAFIWGPFAKNGYSKPWLSNTIFIGAQAVFLIHNFIFSIPEPFTWIVAGLFGVAVIAAGLSGERQSKAILQGFYAIGYYIFVDLIYRGLFRNKIKPHLSRGVTQEDAQPIQEAVALAIAEGRVVGPDAKTQALIKEVVKYLDSHDQGAYARLVERSEFRFMLPSSDIRNHSPPYYIWYVSDKKFVLATTVQDKDLAYALIPYQLISYLSSLDAPVSIIAEIFLHEARHVNNKFDSSRGHDNEARDIVCLVEPFINNIPTVSIKDFISLLGYEISMVLGLNLNNEEDREQLRNVIRLIREKNHFQHRETIHLTNKTILTIKNKEYSLQGTALIAFVFDPALYLISNDDLYRSIETKRAELDTISGFVERTLVSETEDVKNYRFLANIYRKVVKDKIDEGVTIEPHEEEACTGDIYSEKIKRNISKTDFASRSMKGYAAIRQRLEAKNIFIPDVMGPIVLKVLPVMLEEAFNKATSDQHQEAVKILEQYTKVYPELIGQILIQFFHVLYQEGLDTEGFEKIFSTESGEIRWTDWRLMDKLDDIYSQAGDKAHDLLLESLAAYIANRGSKKLRILAIGTGSGKLAEDLVDRFGDMVEVVDTDYEPECIIRNYWIRTKKAGVYSKQIKGLPTNVANLRSWPSDYFDAVVGFGCLRYFVDLVGNQAATEIARVLKPDAVAFMGEAVQRYTRPNLIARFEKLLNNQNLHTKVLSAEKPVFRCTTFYNLLHQYESFNSESYPGFTRDYVVLLRKLIKHLQDDDADYYEACARIVGTKQGNVRMIVAAKQESGLDLSVPYEKHLKKCTARVVTSRERLAKVDKFIVNELASDGVVMIDIGTGYPPFTTLESAQELNKYYKNVKVVGVEYNYPAYVVIIPVEGKGRTEILFSHKGEIIAIDHTWLEIVPKVSKIPQEEIKRYLAIRDQLITQVKGADYEDAPGNIIQFDPMSRYATQTNGLSFIPGDFRTLRLAYQADIVRVFNVMTYYQDTYEEELKKISEFVKESGYLIVGVSASRAGDVEEYITYQKRDERLVPLEFAFTVRFDEKGCSFHYGHWVNYEHSLSFSELYEEKVLRRDMDMIRLILGDAKDQITQEQLEKTVLRLLQILGYQVRFNKGGAISVAYSQEGGKIFRNDSAVQSPKTDSEIIEAFIRIVIKELSADKDRAYQEYISRETDILVRISNQVGLIGAIQLASLLEIVQEYDYSHGSGFAETITDLFELVDKAYLTETSVFDGGSKVLLNLITKFVKANQNPKDIWSIVIASQGLANPNFIDKESTCVFKAMDYLRDAPMFVNEFGLETTIRYARIMRLIQYVEEEEDFKVAFDSLIQSMGNAAEYSDKAQIGKALDELENSLVNALKLYPLKVAEVDSIGYEDDDSNSVVKQLFVVNKMVKNTLWGGKIYTEAVRQQKRKGRQVHVVYFETKNKVIIVGQATLKLENNQGFGRWFAVLDCFQRGFGIGSLLAEAGIRATMEAGASRYYVYIREDNNISLSFFRGLPDKLKDIIKAKSEEYLDNPWKDTNKRIVKVAYELQPSILPFLSRGLSVEERGSFEKFEHDAIVRAIYEGRVQHLGELESAYLKKI